MSAHAPQTIEKYAATDAMLDGTGTQFQAFFAQLKHLAGSVTKDGAVSTLNEFHQWSKDTGQEFEEKAGNLPDDVDIDVAKLERQTMDKLEHASKKHAGKIVQMEKEKGCWERRFGPSLATDVDNQPPKNVGWLIGLALFLVALESIANSQFFATGNEFGLLGGTLFAIVVSLGNVGIPMLLAFFGHRSFCRYDAYRAFGVAAIVLFLLWTFGFNHIVAQYRESLEAAGSDSSTLNYVLLFALGAAVAGISFWKMWSFLDPFKKARKCMEDLRAAQEAFRQDVYADLRAAQTKHTTMKADIRRRAVEIPGRLQWYESEYARVHDEVIDKANQVFTHYHGAYSAKKVAPVPDRPIVTPENAETEYGVGIPTAAWEFFATRKVHLTKLIDDAQKEWVPQLRELLMAINELLKRFGDVIIAKLEEWSAREQPAQAQPA